MDKSVTSNIELYSDAKKLGIPINDILYKDQLKTIKPKYGSYIINLEDEPEPTFGSHWICLFIGKRNAFFFDSFGFKPPQEVLNFIPRKLRLVYSEKQIQNPNSGYCGAYCLRFLEWIHKSATLENYQRFLDKFSSNVEENLKILKSFR